jgi:hypothetical protein
MVNTHQKTKWVLHKWSIKNIKIKFCLLYGMSPAHWDVKIRAKVKRRGFRVINFSPMHFFHIHPLLKNITFMGMAMVFLECG